MRKVIYFLGTVLAVYGAAWLWGEVLKWASVLTGS